jgi:putative membrane protein
VSPARETQPERTDLAWQRTGLGVLAVAALLAHSSVEAAAPARLAVAGGVALLGLGLLGGLAPLRARLVRRALRDGRGVAAPAMAAVAAGVVVLVAAAALVSVLTPR